MKCIRRSIIGLTAVLMMASGGAFADSETPSTATTRLESIREGYNTQPPAQSALQQDTPIQLANRHSPHHRFFDLYNISVLLFDDYDHNGFYSEFSLSFDLDVEYGSADVYAEIYIRQHGYDFELLHVTEIFTIWHHAAYDSYEVTSTLLENYPSAYYDLHIELYDAYGSPYEPVAIADSDYYAELYALPLESRHYHATGSAVSVSYGGTGSPFLALLSLILVWLIRTIKPPIDRI